MTPSATTALTASVEDLMTTFAERVASSFQFTYGVSDVSDLKLSQDGVLTRNPDDTLWKTTLTVKGSNLARSVGELHAAFTAAAEYKLRTGATRLVSPVPLDASSRELDAYFSRTRPIDRLGRALGAITLSSSFLERAELDFGASGVPSAAQDRTKWTFDVTFDPGALFVTAGQKKQAFEAITAHLKLHPDAALALTHGDGCVAEWASVEERFTARKACVRRLAGLSGLKAWAAALVPTVKIESIDEFDYSLIGGQPILFPEREGALQNYLLSWDLLKIIKPSAARLDAVAALKALDQLDDTRRTFRALLAVTPQLKVTRLSLVKGGFVATKLEATVPDVEWSRPADGVWQVDGLYLTKDGMLVGQPACQSQQEGCTVQVQFTDKAGRSHVGTLRLDLVEASGSMAPATPGL